jgi:hypothetical protein
MPTKTIPAADVPVRWPDIFTELLAGEQEFLITDGQQVKAVIIDQARYYELVTLARREERRQRALALPLAAAESPATWETGFKTLERISEKFADLSDEDMDTLFGAVLTEIRNSNQE